MKNAILLHGMPSEKEYYKSGGVPMSQKHWFSWLQKELTLRDIKVEAPDLPEPYKPDYEKWKKVFERFPVSEETILVGHSCGGGFLVRWLSENKINVGKVALVAPWINALDPRPVPGFFDFRIDPELVSRTNGMSIFISLDDDYEELETAEMLKLKLKDIKIMQFTDKGHFTIGDMGTEEFPELVEFLIS